MKKKYKYILPKRPYFQYLALLILSFVLFTAYAFMPDDIEFLVKLKKMNRPIVKANVVKQGKAPKMKRESEQNSMASDTCADIYEMQGILDTSRQKFLLIGDSMGEFLRLRLNDYCKQNGHTMESVIWYSSSTEVFGSCDTLSYFINTYQPTYILLSLGSNELFIKDIKEKREAYVQNILSEIGDIPYIWIGPPNWKEDTGINSLIVENVGVGHYFESKKLTYERCSDQAHPVKSSAYVWMDSIASFLYHDAAHRVVMDFPECPSAKIPHTVLLSPQKK